jgi:hypothetical protein
MWDIDLIYSNNMKNRSCYRKVTYTRVEGKCKKLRK